MAREGVDIVEIDGVTYARGRDGELTWRRGGQVLSLSRLRVVLPPGADGPAPGQAPTESPIVWEGVEIDGWLHLDADGRPTGLHVADYDVTEALTRCQLRDVVCPPGWGTVSLHGYLLLSQIHGAGVGLVVRAGLVAAEGVWRDVLSRYAGQSLVEVTGQWTPSTGAAVQRLARAHAIADARAMAEGAASREAIGAADRLAQARAVAAAALASIGGAL
jgi:hypothetical protein